MAQTTHGVPYPLPDEPVAEGAARIRDVAEYLDAHVLTELLAAGELRAYSGAPEQVRIGGALPGYPSIYFGPAGDTQLYRTGPASLRTEGSLTAGANLTAGGNVQAVGTLYVGNAGVIFGPAYDANLYRAGAGQLKTDGLLMAGQQLYANFGAAAQIQLATDGAVYFGVDNDTRLYRSGVGILATGGQLRAGSVLVANDGTANQVGIGTPAGGGIGPGLSFGAANDTNVYRAGAGILKTDGKLVVGGLIRTPWQAPTGVGAIIAKIAIADVNETQLGYVPVYSTI